MSAAQSQPSTFTREVVAYLRYYRALGLRYRGVEHVLSRLGRYLAQNDAQDLDRALYERWCCSHEAWHANTRRKAEQIVRRFCLYRRRSDAAFFVPNADAFSRLRPYVRPVIVEPEQIARMLAVADQLAWHPKSPLYRRRRSRFFEFPMATTRDARYEKTARRRFFRPKPKVN